MSLPPDPPKPPEEKPTPPPKPEIPAAWREPSDDRKWKSSAPPDEPSIGAGILQFIGWLLLGIGGLAIVGGLLLLGTCLVMLSK